MIICGDALTKLKELESDSIDCIVTDPPYGYSFMNKDWDRVVVNTDIWKECLRVLKPGAFAFIMCAPRQDVLSRQIVNLQDAGFLTGFTSIYWTYASGFPKAADVSKLIDKRSGTEREVIGERPNRHGQQDYRQHVINHGYRRQGDFEVKSSLPITKPATDAAKQLSGAYAGFQPKPAVEVVLTVMKPLSEKSYVDQALANKHGVTWLDLCRIPYDIQTDEQPRIRQDKHETRTHTDGGYGGYGDLHNSEYFNQSGRFPANLLVENDVLNDGKITKSRGSPPNYKPSESEANTMSWYERGNTRPFTSGTHFDDSGSYSRYFDLDKWFDTTFPFAIIPKPSKREKNMGLDKWIPSKVNDGRKTEIDNPFQRGESLRQNTHPTVKPLKLMCYLIALGSRPDDTILDPFCGSGTTLIAANMLKRVSVGIELNPDYIKIAEARLENR